jgi:hypothetical protein
METKNILLGNLRQGKAALLNSISSYAAAGIDIEIINISNNTAEVIIKQSRLINGYILNQKQLVERCKDAFEPTGLKTLVKASVFSLDVEDITVEWINSKMNEFGIKRNDLVKQLAFDKSYISRLFGEGNSKIQLTKQVKAAFFYYFLTYELNRDFRE